MGARVKVKRVVRYLLGAERVVWKYGELEGGPRRVRMDIHVDSDWAGNLDRKSTSGGMMMLEGVGVKHWGRTQRTRALSAGEAEYYAVVTGCAEGLGAKSLAEDMGYIVDVSIWTDSDAGRSMASRRRLGKVRHLELRYLWVQDVVRERRLRIRRVDGEVNLADHR